MARRRIIAIIGILALLAIAGYAVYSHFMAPTRILVVNALKAQQADIVLSNDHPQIKVDCVEAEEMGSLAGYDAVIIYARRLFLTPEQEAEVKRVAEKGIPVYTKTLRSNDFVENHNLSEEQIATLQEYFDNENRQNYRNGLRYLRYIATPQRWGEQTFDKPIEVLKDMYYHREYGQYFKTHDELTQYLKERHLYHAGAQTLALISGITFPMEGNREHVDTLITMLTQRGFNVYPMTSSGKKREKMLHQLKPDGVVYMAMGRLGNDTLIQWLQEKNIALFCPFPMAMTHEEWMNKDIPMSSGSKNARIVIPEIDGGTAPYAIATQNPNKEGYHINTAEIERCEMLVEHICRSMSLRQKKNSEKRIAIGYFKRPGKDALLASGMEVTPSMYNLLKRLQQEGYNVSGLPSTLEAFAKAIKTEGLVLGSYAKGAQEEYLSKGHPLWLSRQQYEQWAKEILPAEKYQEVISRYGEAPGELLAKGDSIAIACVRYGNVLLFPQPRPALGDDDFKLVHGVEVAPPHGYLAPYLYMQKGFQADALIHFGTYGNLEYTPGRDAGMRPQDWSQQLVGPTPHFYYYTTSNIGEAIIAILDALLSRIRWYPGLLILLAAFYVLCQMLFSLTGVGFQTTGLLSAGALAITLLLLSKGMTWLLPEKTDRNILHTIITILLCLMSLVATQQSVMVYPAINQNIIMEYISRALFGIANILLIPDVIMLIIFFIRSIILLVTTSMQYANRRKDGYGSLYTKYRSLLYGQEPNEAYADYLAAQMEAEAAKDVNLSRLLTKLGPVLGLIGTLISMSPALVDLSTGDISGMAYNMQVVFSATVVGLVISVVGLFTQQLKSRWHQQDISRLEYVSSQYIEKHEKEA